MKIKKFIAGNMREALVQIKKELGEDAVILKTKRIPRGMFDFLGKEQIEVTAALDENIRVVNRAGQPVQSVDSAMKLYGRSGYLEEPDKMTKVENYHPPKITKEEKPEELQPRSSSPVSSKNQKTLSTMVRPLHTVTPQGDLKFEYLQDDLNEIRSAVQSMADYLKYQPGLSLPPLLRSISTSLMEQEVHKEYLEIILQALYTELVGEQLEDSLLIHDLVMENLAEGILVSGPIQLKQDKPTVVALIGPTGMGKTTTLAKLASQYALFEKKKVGLITVDTYRIGAVEQLKMFAEIAHLPLSIVFSPQEISAALAAYADCDLVLVDHAGRSYKHQEHMDELARFIAAIRPDECHLVLSATTKFKDLEKIIERYQEVFFNRLLFTKLDETSIYGALYNILKLKRIPLSYLATGQGVPDDIEIADPKEFIKRIFRGVS